MSALAPLVGRTVVDLSQQLPGPFATLLLRSLGARVIKVEPPGGDPGRRIDPPMFARMVADKEVVTLDLKSADGRAELHTLAAAADVFLEGFRPGVAERLAADRETLARLNPRLVYCSLSGYGASGPLAKEPGHDLNFLALAGGLPAGTLDGEALIRVPWVDLAAGTNAALAILAALLEREATGEGAYLEMAMLDAAAVWANAKPPRPGGEGAYGVFATADGERVAISVMEEDAWLRLCAAFDWEWSTDPELATHEGRRAAFERIRARLREEIAARSLAAVIDLAERHDLGISRVKELADAAADPQLATRAIYPRPNVWKPLGGVAGSLPISV